MDQSLLKQHRLSNSLQSLFMLVGLAFILGFVGWTFGGAGLMVGMFLAGSLGLWFAPKVSTKAVLKMYKAQRLDARTAPALLAIMNELSLRARLEFVPQLHYVPSQLMNAFAVGTGRDASVAITDGLLRKLNRAELAGVLAHEVAHIQNNDVRVMGMADMLSRLTHTFSLVGQFLLLFNLPMILIGQATVSWFAIAVLIFAPQISALLQLGLSRTREFDADRSAAELTGDPRSLARALKKLDLQGKGWFERVFMPNRHTQEPSLLRTHPPTIDRVNRLLGLDGVITARDRLEERTGGMLDWLQSLNRPSKPKNHFFRGLRF